MTSQNAKPRRIVVLIGGSGSNLQALIDHPQHRVTYDIVGVISHRPDVLGLQRAQKALLPAQVIDHSAFDSRAAFEDALLTAVSIWQPDWIALAGFMRVLSPHFINAFPNRILNIHPALLPKYKGLHTHRRALEAGDTEHGATVHVVTADLDDGPIIAQATVPVLSEDTEATLAARVLKAEHQLYPQVVALAADGRLSLSQNKALIHEPS